MLDVEPDSAIDWKWKDILRDLGPLNSFNFYLITAISLVANLSIIVLLVMLEENYSLKMQLIVALYFSFLPYAFLTIKFHGLYKRNIIGNNLWFYFDDRKQINVISVFSRDSFFLSGTKCAIVIPLGGWFNKKPRIWYGAQYKFDQTNTYWGLKNFRPHYDSVTFAESMISIINRHGEKIDLQIYEALQLIRDIMSKQSASPPMMPFGMKYFSCHCAKRLLQLHNNEMLGLLTQTVISIAETKRFGKSKEAARIREQLIEDTLKFLPQDDSRRKILESFQKATAA